MGSFFLRALNLNQYSTATAQPGLSVNVINAILLPIPPLAEQKRIVAQIENLLKCVDEIDRESETLEKSITLAKQKILDLAIRGKLVPQDPADEPASELLKKIKAEKEALIKAGKLKRDKHESFIFRGDDNCYYEQLDGKTVDITAEIPFEIPQSWCWCRQETIISLVSGQDFPPAGYNADHIGIPYITGASNMVDGKIIINRWTKIPSSIAIAGDILITCKGAGVGKMAYMDIPRAHIARQIMAVRPIGVLSSKFIETVLQGQFSLIREQMNGLIPGISRDVMLNLLFPLPPLSEQQRIVEAIGQYNSIFKTISK